MATWVGRTGHIAYYLPKNEKTVTERFYPDPSSDLILILVLLIRE